MKDEKTIREFEKYYQRRYEELMVDVNKGRLGCAMIAAQMYARASELRWVLDEL